MIQDLIDRSMFHFTSSPLAFFTPENRIPLAFACAAYDLGARYATDQIATGDAPSVTVIHLAAAFSEFHDRARMSTQLRSVTLK